MVASHASHLQFMWLRWVDIFIVSCATAMAELDFCLEEERKILSRLQLIQNQLIWVEKEWRAPQIDMGEVVPTKGTNSDWTFEEKETGLPHIWWYNDKPM